jgi:hypothetical protein
MYPYTKELTIDEALNILLNAKCQSYENDGKIYLTALDYATHILKQAAPPEGWGYAAYDEPERYKDLEFVARATYDYWQVDRTNFSGHWFNWSNYAFRLTDLARVEEQSELLQPATCCPKCYEVMIELKQEIADLQLKSNNDADIYDLQDRLLDAQNCIAVQELEITKLKNYIINQLLTK